LFDDASFLKESREDLLALLDYGPQSIRARYFIPQIQLKP